MSKTIPDTHQDLLTAPVASLTTLGPDGAPQSTLVWFAFDASDQMFKLLLSSDRVKTQNLLARPQVSLLILDPLSPMRYMDVRGMASTTVDTEYAWADAHIKTKYGVDVRDQPDSTRYVVAIAPTHIYAAAL